MQDCAVCVLTQTVVDPNAPAFLKPSKPTDGTFTADEAQVRREQDGWSMAEDAGRGYRRVVASPQPLRTVETTAIRTLLGTGLLVAAAGVGGIPVMETEPGIYKGVETVIDKDLVSALLASSLGVPLLVISTGVERVAIRFRQPDQQSLDRVTLSEIRQHLEAGKFPEGSMGPKIRAAIQFLEQGGEEVIITSLEHLEAAVAGQAGTHIVHDGRTN